MTKLAEFRAAERRLADQLAQLEHMRGDSGLQTELQFNDELKALMKAYDMPARTVVAILASSPPA